MDDDQAPLLGLGSSVQFPESDRYSGRRGTTSSCRRRYRGLRSRVTNALKSRLRHWVVLTLVILDVAGILSDIFIALITCELHRQKQSWVKPTREALASFSLLMSCLFLLELLLSLWIEGLAYLSDWFHCFDAFVIIISFAVDLLEHGLAEEIASLVVVLRLWRFVKIINELSVEAAEQMGEIQNRVEELQRENTRLLSRLAELSGDEGGGL